MSEERKHDVFGEECSRKELKLYTRRAGPKSSNSTCVELSNRTAYH